MDETALRILLDQNIPFAVSIWLSKKHPNWIVHHVNNVGLQGNPDIAVFKWAQENGAIVITYDEDFADSRMYSLGKHHGVIRLRVWPTTVEKTQDALDRLFTQVSAVDLQNSLIIVDNYKIRVRKM